MRNLIQTIVYKLGIDGAIFYTTLGRAIQSVGGIVSVLFVARFLTGQEQGFYYTFGSIAALQIFFELGLGGIITQYVAHEVSHLKWVDKVTLEGEEIYRSRLSSLLHFCYNWYAFFAFFLVATLFVVGFLFFWRYDTSVGTIVWQSPWVLIVLGTGLNFLTTSVIAFINGLGQVKEVAKIRFVQQLVGLGVVWIGLGCGLKLYVLGLNSISGVVIVVFILFFGKYRQMLTNIWKVKITDKVHYRKEIFPYQWKIALSWVSGYFVFQFFNPVLFATEGPVVAGQMGMTLTALNAVTALSLSWMSTKIPMFSGLIALRKFVELDKWFKNTLKQSVFINGAALIALAFVIYMVRYWNIQFNGMYLGNRFLPYLPMFLMMIPVFLNQFTGSWAIYLRSHKKEPLLAFSIVSGILCSLSTIFLGRYFGVMGVSGGYCLITLLLFPWAYSIYRIKKKEWHVL